MFAYTLRRLQFSNWISLIWKRVLCGKTLPSDLALTVRGLDTASVRSTQLAFLHLGSLSQHSKAETQTQQMKRTLFALRAKPLYVRSMDGVLLRFELCLEHLVPCW